MIISLRREFLLPLLLYLFHQFLVFEYLHVQAIIELDENYHEPQIINNSLEVEEVGVSGEPVEPCDPQKQRV